MKQFGAKYEKYFTWISLGIMVLSLVPMMVLGFYGHPVGDDFYYSQIPNQVWKESENIIKVLEAAFLQTIRQYNIWQGTYSAMFLMHLSPHMWGEFFHKLYPMILMLIFAGSIFYFTKALFSRLFQASSKLCILISSLLVWLCTQQVPLCGETFYWYNGSMYYTGFFACTLMFWGFLINHLYNLKLWHTVVLSMLALFIAGGNYVSLLPTMIIMVLLVFAFCLQRIIYKKTEKRTILYLCITLFFLLLGFSISAMAPGNAIRQATSFKLSPIKAILKAVYQNSRYFLCWNGIYSLLFLALITPAFILIIKRCKCKFRYPIIVCGLIFGIYCSSSCPTFYAQGNGGAARVFCLVYYIMVLAETLIYFYALGALCRWLESEEKKAAFLKKSYWLLTCVGILLLVLCWINPFAQNPKRLNGLTAWITIINGDADYYEEQYQERLLVLKDDTIKDAVLEPYDVPEALISFLHVGDISSDKNQHVNKSVAVAYGKDSVIIQSNN